MQAHVLIRTVRRPVRPGPDVETWAAGARRFGGRTYLRRAEGVFLEDAGRRSNSVALLEVFLSDDAACIKDECARIGDADLLVTRLNPVKGVLLDQVLVVEQPEGADRLAAYVRKERVRDSVLVSKGGQRLHAVVAERKEGYAGSLQPPPRVLQLHELHFAVGSPACAAIDN